MLISTPNGMNMFYKMWMEATANANGFLPVKAIWSDIPTRDSQWAAEQKAVLGEVSFQQECECVAGGTIVTIRDKETGEILNIPIEELHLLNG